MGEQTMEERVAGLEARVETLESRLRAAAGKPMHHRDFSPLQREVVDAVVLDTGVAWNDLLSADRGPAPTAGARMLLYATLFHEAEMSAAQIGRMMGRTRAAVVHGIKVVEASWDAAVARDEARVEVPAADEGVAGDEAGVEAGEAAVSDPDAAVRAALSGMRAAIGLAAEAGHDAGIG